MNLSEGIRLFNDHDFFSAHDYFENLWIDSGKDMKLFLQGLVQVSVGCYHVVCGNLNGAENQFKKAKSKLVNYKPEYLKINLDDLLKDLQVMLIEIKNIKTEKKEKINLELLPTLKQI